VNDDHVKLSFNAHIRQRVFNNLLDIVELGVTIITGEFSSIINYYKMVQPLF